MNSLIFKLILIILGLMSAFILYKSWILPSVLIPNCLVNSNNCLEIKYFKKQNSALVFVNPTGYTIWCNAGECFLYGINTGYVCKDPKYEAAFKIEKNRKSLENYTCILSVREVLKQYADISPMYLYKRVIFSKFDVYKLLDILVDNKIIVIQ